MVVATSPVSPLFVGLMLIMIMVSVPVFMTITDELLAMRITAKMFVLPPVLVKMQIGLRLVHYDLPAMVQVETRIGRGKLAGKGPVSAAIQVNEFMRRDIIVALDIGNIIIFHVLIARRTPGRLIADVDGKMDLRLSGV